MCIDINCLKHQPQRKLIGNGKMAVVRLLIELNPECYNSQAAISFTCMLNFCRRFEFIWK